MKVFISHSSKDTRILQKLVKDLESYDIQSWYSENEIEIADSLIGRMQEGLKEASYVILMLSPNSMKSEWVTLEIQEALYQEIQFGKNFLIPIIIKTCDIPPFVRTKRYVDFRQGYKTGFKELLSFLLSKKDSLMNVSIGEPEKQSSFLKNIFDLNPLYKKYFRESRFSKKDLIRLIRNSECLRKGNFQLTSGKFSSYYIMPRKCLEDIISRNASISLLFKIISAEHKSINAIIYPALTDGSLVGHLLAEKMKIRTKVPLHVSVNKRQITIRPIDLETLSGKTCLYVDDVITTGDGLMIVMDSLLKQKINVVCIATLFVRSQTKLNQLTNYFLKMNVSLNSLFIASLIASSKKKLSSIPVERIN